MIRKPRPSAGPADPDAIGDVLRHPKMQVSSISICILCTSVCMYDAGGGWGGLTPPARCQQHGRDDSLEFKIKISSIATRMYVCILCTSVCMYEVGGVRLWGIPSLHIYRYTHPYGEPLREVLTLPGLEVVA